MSEEEIFSVLSDSQRRYIAEFCTEPHSSDEIWESVRANWSGYPKSTLASDLKRLETSKALVFVEEKWKTTEITKKVLKKYFGH